MHILIAEDDSVSRLRLEDFLTRRGYTVSAVANGAQAWQLLQGEARPSLAILDWLMPEVDGIELCRRVRAEPQTRGVYLLLLTGQGGREHVLAGLQAGANDYLTKPFDPAELEYRLRAAAQLVELQAELARRVKDLESALAEVKLLQGMLPICCYCKNVRDDQHYWHKVEQYIIDHSEATVTSGVCPACWERYVKPQFEQAGKPVPPHPSTVRTGG